jgi:5-methylcytosine-specific restriction endonuclease McrA
MSLAATRVAPEKADFRPVLSSLPQAGFLPEKLMATAFWQKYKDPRWQKRRLEIMEKAGWECERCGSKDDTLNVHHKLYRRGADPWDYSDHELQCMCEGCHGRTHDIHEWLKTQMARLNETQLLCVLGYMIGMELFSSRSPEKPNEFESAKDLFDHFGWEIFQGVGDAYGLSEPEMDGVVRDDGVLDGDLLWDAVRAKRARGE